MNCGACHEKDIEAGHQCIEARYLLEVRHWLYDGLEDVGHDLGHYFAKVQRNTPLLRKYAHAVANDAESTYRAGIHLNVCAVLGVERQNFKPFHSEKITKMPTQDEAMVILWDAVREHLWTYTKTYRQFKKTYSEAVALREKYFPARAEL